MESEEKKGQSIKWAGLALLVIVVGVVTCVMLNKEGVDRNDDSNEVTGYNEYNILTEEETNNTNEEEYVVAEIDLLEPENLAKDNISISPLSISETEGLLLMREEEKLARDVYLTLGEKWGIRIFNNIAESEQTHTDAVKYLLDVYDIEDPVKNDAVGSFTAPEMAELYDELVSQGEKSLLNALMVGATVEDLDINDLDKLMAETSNPEILSVYENLQRGSRNHMRAFIRQIGRNGGDYIPQYISQVEFETIINSDQEKGGGRM